MMVFVGVSQVLIITQFFKKKLEILGNSLLSPQLHTYISIVFTINIDSQPIGSP